MADERSGRGPGRPSTAEQVSDAVRPISEEIGRVVDKLVEERAEKQVFRQGEYKGPFADDLESATDADVDKLCDKARGEAEKLGHTLGPWERGRVEAGLNPPRMPNPTYRIAHCLSCRREVTVRYGGPALKDPTRRRNMHKFITPHMAGFGLHDSCDGTPQSTTRQNATRDPRILGA